MAMPTDDQGGTILERFGLQLPVGHKPLVGERLSMGAEHLADVCGACRILSRGKQREGELH